MQGGRSSRMTQLRYPLRRVTFVEASLAGGKGESLAFATALDCLVRRHRRHVTRREDDAPPGRTLGRKGHYFRRVAAPVEEAWVRNTVVLGLAAVGVAVAGCSADPDQKDVSGSA